MAKKLINTTILPIRNVAPKLWIMIFYGDGVYTAARQVNYTLDEAIVKAKREDSKLESKSLWWYFSESAESLNQKFSTFL